jgi:hypothetical protein
MLGGMLGVIVLAGAFWLYQFGARVREQGEALGVLSRLVQESSDAQRVALDLVVDRAKGDKSPELIERYSNAVKERAELAKRLESQTMISRTMAARSKDVEAELDELRASLEAARRELAGNAREVEEASKLREQVAKLEETARAQKSLLDKQADIVESVEGEHARQLLDRLTWVRVLAYLGWGLSVLLGLAATAAWFRRGSPGRGELDSSVPHQIM